MTTREAHPPDYADWYDRFGYRKSWTARECDFIEAVIRKHSRTHGRRLLDIACGTGRHAIELARRGYQVTGIDVSEGMIGVARGKASPDAPVCFEVVDMRCLPFQEQFDAAYMWFNTFPLLVTDDDVLSTLRGINKSLVEGGVFVFQFSNPAKSTGSRSRAEYRYDDGRVRFVQRGTRRVCPEGHIVHRIIEVERWQDGKGLQPIVEDFKQRAYSVDDIELLARLAGLRLLKVYGAPDLESGFPEHDDEIIPVLAKLPHPG